MEPALKSVSPTVMIVLFTQENEGSTKERNIALLATKNGGQNVQSDSGLPRGGNYRRQRAAADCLDTYAGAGIDIEKLR
ncbi:hypothetical protein CHS0354_019788 [Potamilus streckersoni]|uniref:Uncharacterized protein n=1 Tax=Potamilus streckersoni TaxID=2493646 RepID=A0AAE0S9N4_9BIVA|nr:hypothetical protein CHS0354_019788 [Potamilus streckersoni]